MDKQEQRKRIIRIIKISTATIAILITLFIVIGLIAFFSLRDKALQQAVAKAERYFETNYNANLHIDSAFFDGFKAIRFTGITLKPIDGDTLAVIDTIYANIHIRPLLRKKMAFKHFNIVNAWFTPVRKDGKDNYSFLFGNEEKEPVETEKAEMHLAKVFSELTEAVFEQIPDNLSFTNLNFALIDDEYRLSMHMPYLTYSDNKYTTSVVLNTPEAKNIKWKANGIIDKKKKLVSGQLYADGNRIDIPYLEEKYNLSVAFDTLAFHLFENNYSNGILKLRGNSHVSGLVVFHPKIDTGNVVVENGGMDFILTIGKKAISIDTPSVITVNQVKLNVAGEYVNDSLKKYRLAIQSEKTPAQDFFESLPKGLFNSFDGIQVAGNLQLSAYFNLDMANVDSVDFDVSLDRENFKILKFGETDFSKLSKSFVHTAYVKGKPDRTFTVGPENPNWTPLEQISPYLKQAVLSSEDGSFFSHEGFRGDAFRSSMALNIKTKSFKRGGSTISMQLIKNAFLSHRKTISRKLEEALIVWLIERNKLTDKRRMFEVYLNMIEWGPSIYGIGEASQYYFSKHPSRLTIAESIYLASIIPRPRSYKSYFNDYGHLRGWLSGYFRKLGQILYRKGTIDSAQYGSLNMYVYLAGPARKEVVTKIWIPPTPAEEAELKEAIEPDEILIEETGVEEEKEKFFKRLFSPRQEKNPEG